MDADQFFEVTGSHCLDARGNADLNGLNEVKEVLVLSVQIELQQFLYHLYFLAHPGCVEMFTIKEKGYQVIAIVCEVERVKNRSHQIVAIYCFSFIKFLKENISQKLSELLIVFVQFNQNSNIVDRDFFNILSNVLFHGLLKLFLQ